MKHVAPDTSVRGLFFSCPLVPFAVNAYCWHHVRRLFAGFPRPQRTQANRHHHSPTQHRPSDPVGRSLHLFHIGANQKVAIADHLLVAHTALLVVAESEESQR